MNAQNVFNLFGRCLTANGQSPEGETRFGRRMSVPVRREASAAEPGKHVGTHNGANEGLVPGSGVAASFTVWYQTCLQGVSISRIPVRLAQPGSLRYTCAASVAAGGRTRLPARQPS